ncbi:sugar ABC transporter ATP-binding protein [Variovorax sp. WS11]|uniref:ABC transporter ATP-binding protein n=1 Tax=Variovorax sp. WS11 TaxID=1105204 RepID=UPI000D0CDFC9|nr:sn-glycerol-3-phosphate ABC transporter ATP-binding protein UgpC [Variovorax sp. WS11]NDZ18712.1 sn-glycerol-3-phosphate ABC transporter ATP-binding protein UgpC [Variovorax sp. WS11]PSL79284.1 sugar ABC transporter ATP-binding protein [Variovorax sp. WS11]
MAEVLLSGIQKRFGAVQVIHGLDLHIHDGEFVALVGPSGCGKSTLLRMIAGLEAVTLGRIHIGGRDVTDLDPKDRDIAMVFQNYALYPHMTVAANMGFSLEHRGRPRPEIAERVRWAADILGLAQLLERYPRQLSGGQRQRVAMGRAIVRDPQVFLFDEPLSNLDAKLRIVMRGEIKGLHQRLKTTTVYVTHDQVEAMTMADRIVVLNAGRVEQVGSPLELFDRPANQFVAGFIGSPAMNFIPGRCTPEGFAAAGVMLPIPAGAGNAHAGREATYGIRPEHFEPCAAGEGVAARVMLVEPLGSETQLVLRLGDAQVIALFHERLAAAPGDVLHLRPKAAAAHLFDAASGVRMEASSAASEHEQGRGSKGQP